MWNSKENVFARSSASFRDGGGGDGEEALRWAALERLLPYARVRRSIFRDLSGGSKEVGLQELEAREQRLLLDRLVSAVDHDTKRFFEQMRHRFEA